MRYLFGWVAVGLLVSAEASAENHAIGGRIGNLGLGVEYSYRLNERLTVRAGLNGSGFSFSETESGIDYSFDLDFDSLYAGIDVHPLKGKFRVSVGALQNDSGLSATGLLAQSVTVGGTTYQAEDVGTLFGRVGFDSVAPYLGVGWDWLHDRKVGVALDIGVLSQGSPIVTLGANGPIASDPDFISDLATERAELQASLDDLDLYPYAMFGFVVRF
jgi:hypothetical protein